MQKLNKKDSSAYLRVIEHLRKESNHDEEICGHTWDIKIVHIVDERKWDSEGQRED